MPASHRGTGFTNLQTYLGLNRGKADEMGGYLVEDAEREGSAADSAITGAAGAFKRAADAGQNVKTLGDVQGVNVADLYRQAASAQQRAQALDTNEGRQTLLAEKYGPTTWGGGALDAALAGNGSANAGIGRVSGSYGKLLERLGTAQQGASTYQPPARPSQPTTPPANHTPVAEAPMDPGNKGLPDWKDPDERFKKGRGGYPQYTP